MGRWNGPWTSDSSENGFTAWSLSRYLCFLHECVPIRCCVPMCPVSGSGVAQGAVMGLSPPGGEFSEVQHLARRRWRHRPRRNPRPAPLLMAHFRPSLVITQYLHCAAHKPQVTCVLLLVSTTHIYLEPNQLTFHISKFHDWLTSHWLLSLSMKRRSCSEAAVTAVSSYHSLSAVIPRRPPSQANA